MNPWGRQSSLNRRVFAGLVLATFCYWSVIAALTVRYNMKEVHELYDIHLAHTAMALLRLNEGAPDNEPVITGEAATATIERIFQNWPDFPQRAAIGKPVFQVTKESAIVSLNTADPEVVKKNLEHGLSMRYQLWRNGGRLLFRSANAPDTTMTTALGFSIGYDAKGKAWRNYSIWDANHKILAIVSERDEDRMQLVRSIAIASMNPLVLGMPMFVLLLLLSVRRGLGPLTKLSQDIAIRDPKSLELIEDRYSPRELQPIVQSLNNLILRMQQTLEAERRFNANIAHELNTPFATIKAHLFVAQRAKNDAERQKALSHVQATTERGIRLISQMLTLARLGPQTVQAVLTSVNLNDIAQDVCAELVPIAIRRGQTLEIQAAAEPMFVKGHKDLLHQLTSNLVDNAMRYTQPEGHIKIQLGRLNAVLRMSVIDDGPGIPEEQREQVFSRYFRLADQSVSGTGLGLAICRKIADIHHAQISLEQGPDGKGLSVHVDFQTAA